MNAFVWRIRFEYKHLVYEMDTIIISLSKNNTHNSQSLVGQQTKNDW